MANEVRLIDAPVGLFLYGDCLALKTEYMMNNRVEAYVVASGEIFWGGVKTADEVNNLLVTPVDPESMRPKGQWIVIDDDYEWDAEADDECYVVLECECSVCGERTKKDRPNYCDNCGAKMEG